MRQLNFRISDEKKDRFSIRLIETGLAAQNIIEAFVDHFNRPTPENVALLTPIINRARTLHEESRFR